MMTSSSKEKHYSYFDVHHDQEKNNLVDEEEENMSMVRLNSALHELGMLSAITESRKQYLEETERVNNAAYLAKESRESQTLEGNLPRHKNGFCVLNMNSNYVTDFSGKWKCCSDSPKPIPFHENLHSHLTDIQSLSKLSVLSLKEQPCCYSRARYKSGRGRLRCQKPYEVSGWLNRAESREWASRWTAATDNDSSSSKESSGGVGNRSNPGSPEKGIVDLTNNLVRSRSLDDIEVINLPSVDASVLGCQKSDIENMSRKMEGLHVN